MRQARSMKRSIELLPITSDSGSRWTLPLTARCSRRAGKEHQCGSPILLPLVVCIKTREQRGEAEQSRALYYNGINAIDPCVDLEDASASVARLLNGQQAGPLKHRSASGKKRKLWFQFASFAWVSPLLSFFT
jgi:hypothetical protein